MARKNSRAELDCFFDKVRDGRLNTQYTVRVFRGEEEVAVDTPGLQTVLARAEALVMRHVHSHTLVEESEEEDEEERAVSPVLPFLM